MDPTEALLRAIAERRHADALASIETGIDLNQPVDNGASPLFTAVLLGELPLVEAMLRCGADANFQALEPACDEYAPTPLDLAMQSRLLMDWDLFHPIVKLLLAHGALTFDGGGDIPDLARAAEESRAWQQARRCHNKM